MAKLNLIAAKITQQSQVDAMHRSSQHLHSGHSVDPFDRSIRHRDLATAQRPPATSDGTAQATVDDAPEITPENGSTLSAKGMECRSAFSDGSRGLGG
jgi:hypothetical protein